MSVNILWISRSGRETLPVVWEWWESLPDVQGAVGRPSQVSLRGGRPFWMCGKPSWLPGSGRESIPDVRE